MAEKDILEKILMSYADVFADCVNAFVYGGKQRLGAGNLHPAPTESFYSGKDRIHNQFCDQSFYMVKGDVIRVQYIIENETQIRNRQVLRKISYHGGAYRSQMDSQTQAPVYPVISIVIDWTRKKTRIPLSLHELLAKNGVPQEEMLMTENVRLNLFHMRNLPKEVRDKFTSDFGFVADYLNEGNFEGRRNQKIVHAEALCWMMEAITGDTRFTDLIEGLMKKQKVKGGEIFMCEYIDMLEARGFKKGEALGLQKGEALGLQKGEILGEARGFKKGTKKGEKKGEKRLADLIQHLLKEGKYDDISLASSNRKKRHELYRRYGI